MIFNGKEVKSVKFNGKTARRVMFNGVEVWPKDEPVPDGDPYWANVVALLHFDGSFTDETGKEWGGVGSTLFEVGRFSNALNTAGGHAQAGGAGWNDLSYGTGDFTIECWIKQTANNNAAGLFAHMYTGGHGLPIAVSFGKIGTTALSNEMYIGFFTGSSWVGSNSTWHPATGEWHHIAAVRQGEKYTLYADGAGVATFESSAVVVSSLPLLVGRRWDTAIGQPRFQGLIDELRITKGIARYTENFDPPTEPFPNYGATP